MKKIIILTSWIVLLFILSLLTVSLATAHTADNKTHLGQESEASISAAAASAAPDAFGYTYQDEVEVNGPAFSFIDISGSGNNLSLNDEDLADITLPFSFNFYGTLSNQLRVSNNGGVIFNFGLTDRIFAFNSCQLNTSTTNNIIAPWWDDWGNFGEVYLQTFGSAPNRFTVIQWNNMTHWPDTSGTNPVTFQLILYETSNVILFQYADTDTDGSFINGQSGTVGIFGTSAVNSLQYESCNSQVLATNRAIRFQRSSLTITKDANPDTPDDFSFTASSAIGNFSLDDDGGAPPLSNSQTFFLLPASSYTVTENTPPSPWGLANLTCSSSLAAVSGFTGTTSIFTPTISTRTVDTSLAPGDAVSCTFTNQNFGTIVITKATDPTTDPQDFGFTSDIPGNLAFTLDTDSADPTWPISRTFANLTPGTYQVQENAVVGWDLSSLICIDPTSNTTTNLGSRQATINIAAGETVTCTFTNAKRGAIIVQKATNPASDSQVFTFTTSIPAVSPFPLDTNPGTVIPTNTRAFTNIISGTYTMQEDIVSGWDLTGLTCDDSSTVNLSSRTATIGLTPGKTVTCVFTNTKLGVINIVKDAQPNHPQDFAFTSSDPTAIPPFSLDDDTDLTLSNALSFTVSPGVYTVTETAVPDWTLTNLTCSDGDSTGNLGTRAATINLAAGEVLTCTFTNRASPGTLIVQKVTTPTSDPQVFTFTTTLPATPTFTLDTNAGSPTPASQTFVISPGLYTLSENTLPDWDLTGSSCDDGSPVNNIDIAPGETVTCVFTNTKRGTIVIGKVTTPGNDAQDFSFTSDMPNNTSFVLDTDPGSVTPLSSLTVPVPPGIYTVTEDLVSGWDLIDLSCFDIVDNGSSGSVLTRTATIDVSSGETVTCTFSNAKRGAIQIIKDAVPNDAQDFAFTSTISGTPTFSLDDDSDATLSNTQTFSDLPQGSYIITETLSVPNWSLTAINCVDPSGGTTSNIGTGAANIGLAPGETVTCTYVNQAAPATLTIQKVTTPASDPQVFTFTTTMPATPTFTLDTDTGSATPVSRTFSITPGTYSINETPLTGWDFNGATCSDDSPLSSVALSPNENVTCTFTNTKRGTIIINKITNPASHPQDFAFTSPTLGNFALDTDTSNSTLPISRSFLMPPGTYAITETAISGWLLSDLTCSDPTNDTTVLSPTVTIDLSSGETVTCNFTNTALPGSITITKNSVPDDPQDFEFALTSAVTNTNFSLDDDPGDATLSNSQTFSNLPLGSYTVIEGATSGWALTTLTCNDPTGDTIIQRNLGKATIVVGPGENITCNFTNTFNTMVGSITIVKSATPTSTQSFTFTGTLGTFSLIDNGTPSNTQNFLNLTPGAYEVNESSLPDWSLTGLTCNDPDSGSSVNLSGRSASIDLDAGENVICTFVNVVAQPTPTVVYLPVILRNFVALPNLISTLSVNTSVNPPIVTVVVRNIGNVSVDEGFWVDFYVNPTTPPGSLTGADRRWQRVSSRGIAWQVTGPLAAGDSITLSSSGGFDPTQSNWGSPLPAGLYNFYALADSFDSNDPTGAIYVEVVESNENDNESSVLGVSVSGLGLETNQSNLPDPAQFPPRTEP